jgi:hypothetical protein
MTHEKAIIRQIEKSTPVVQTYIQNMKPDPHLYQVPVSDQFMIGRVDFGKAFVADEYEMRQPHTRFFGGSLKFVSQLTKAFHLENSPTGFMAMMFIDPTAFDMQHQQPERRKYPLLPLRQLAAKHAARPLGSGCRVYRRHRP